jgi:hypothetical protein
MERLSLIFDFYFVPVIISATKLYPRRAFRERHKAIFAMQQRKSLLPFDHNEAYNEICPLRSRFKNANENLWVTKDKLSMTHEITERSLFDFHFARFARTQRA